MRCLFFIVCFLLTGVVHAEFIDDVEKKYNTLKSWQASFVQTTHVDMLRETLTKMGKISVQRPDRLHIEYMTEPRKFYVSNGKKLWVYQNGDETVTEFSRPKEVISREAWSFLSGLEGLSELFVINTKGVLPIAHVQIKSPHLKLIQLVPKNEDAAVRALILGVEAKTLIVKEAIMVTASGNETHYEFTNFYFNQPLGDEFFILPKGQKKKILHQ